MRGIAGVTDFEPIYSALFGHLSAIPRFVTASRRVKHWSDVDPSQQPALFMGEESEGAEQKRGFPPKWRPQVRLYVYIHSGEDPAAVPAIQMNATLKLIREALAPEPLKPSQTLGGLVSHCWITNIERDGGLLGGQSVAIIDVELFLA